MYVLINRDPLTTAKLPETGDKYKITWAEHTFRPDWNDFYYSADSALCVPFEFPLQQGYGIFNMF
jgi:hypothetical protein